MLLFWITSILAGIGFYSIIKLPIDREPPIDFLVAEALSNTAPAGGTIDIRFDVYRSRICQVLRVIRIIQDSEQTVHSVSNYTTATTTRPGRETYERTISIPSTVKPGLAFYQVQIEYACNWTQNLGWPIVVTSPPVWFQVTASINLPPTTPPELQPQKSKRATD